MKDAWNRWVARWNAMTREQRQMLRNVDALNAAFNKGVTTRQVRRARARVNAQATIDKQYGGETRRARRNMARRLAARSWRAIA